MEPTFNSPEKLVLPLKALEELISINSRKTVGKCLKRFEISDNKETIKLEVKEIIYESFRDLVDSLIVLNYGIQPQIYEFKSKETK